MSLRRTYKVVIEVTIQVDDETTKAVERMVSEHLGMMYHKMEREDDIRIVLQNKVEVLERF
jgi:enhancing lycopene biosynthesis protein 2